MQACANSIYWWMLTIGPTMTMNNSNIASEYCTVLPSETDQCNREQDSFFVGRGKAADTANICGFRLLRTEYTEKTNKRHTSPNSRSCKSWNCVRRPQLGWCKKWPVAKDTASDRGNHGVAPKWSLNSIRIIFSHGSYSIRCSDIILMLWPLGKPYPKFTLFQVHNIPEGLAVGVGFGAVGSSASATFESAR